MKLRWLSVLINSKTSTEPRNYSIPREGLLFAAVCVAISTEPIAFGLADSLLIGAQLLFSYDKQTG